MMNPSLTNDEVSRLKALDRYQILDTLPEAVFDDLTHLAAFICQTPIALISLVDRDRQWFKAKVGLTTTETSRYIAFCTYAIQQDEPLVIPDAQADPRFSHNPLVTGPPHIRFYAGTPLITPQGDRLGTLCVIDRFSRQLSPEQLTALQVLSRQVVAQLELRSQLAEHQRTEQYLRTVNEQPPEHSGCWQDMTERKQAELAQQESEEKFRLLVEGVKDYAIYLLSPTAHVISWNAGAETITGYTADEIIGQHVSYFYIPEEIEQGKPELALKTAIAQGYYESEGWRMRKDGTRFWANVVVTALYEESGALRGFSKVTRDITEKRQLEQQFLRTQRLESLGTLAGGIAHDLNNILAPILMAAHLLQLHIKDEYCQSWIEIVGSSARRGADLVKQVLSFARGVEGERVILEVKHLLHEIQQIMVETFPKSLSLSVNITRDLWTVWGDITQLHQVLMNLCVNARDAMPQGGTLSIYAENLVIDENYARMQIDANVGPYVCISVRDTGTGISAEILDHVFDPFFTTKDIGNGTGMGLATVLSIVKSHGGFITVSSEVNKGTEFKVYLPALEQAMTEIDEQQEVPLGQNQLILVVDDEAAIREISKTSLEKYGYRALTAADGIEAIALYAQRHQEVDLVLIDMMMPILDGATTIRALRKINPAIKIIAVSGLISSHKLADPLNTEVQAFLAKPFTAKELLIELDRTLSK